MLQGRQVIFAVQMSCVSTVSMILQEVDQIGLKAKQFSAPRLEQSNSCQTAHYETNT